MGHIDARVRYTKMVIENSFLDLMKSKPYTKITVTEICQCAEINRATFYKHYLDVQDLLEQIEQDLFDRIRATFDADELDLHGFLLRMMYYSMEAKERFFALGGENGDPDLMAKTFLVSYEIAYPLLSQNLANKTESERQMLYHFISQGSGGVLTWWIRDGMREPPEDVANFILQASTITADGIKNHVYGDMNNCTSVVGGQRK